jgi:hypothetical protein
MFQGVGQVIQLMPGGGHATRRDWSPIAQAPDRHDVIAHTPDPNAYHSMGGRTMLPRHSGDYGGSRGFSTKPGVVNVDPTNPVTGEGGITVDLETVGKRDYEYAANAAGGNPLLAWSIAASRQKKEGSFQPPQQQAIAVNPYGQPGGYVTPHTDPSGGIIPMSPVVANPAAMFASPTQGVAGSVMPLAPAQTTITNSAVKPRKNSMMPQELAASWEQPQQHSPVLATQHPTQQQHAMPAQAAPQYHPNAQAAPQAAPQAAQPYLQHGQVQHFHGLPYAYNANTNSWDALQAPPPPPPRPLPPPPPPAAAPMPADVVTDTLTFILKELKALKSGEAQTQPAPRSLELHDWEHDRQRLKGAAEEAPLNTFDGYEELKMPWLGREAAAPRFQVIFRTPNGMLRTRYHFAARRGICLSLVFDSRYDGDQFIPSTTPPGETIQVEIPQLRLKAEAMVFDYHNAIGCLDIVNLILVDNDRMDGPPVMTEETEVEIHSLARRGAL